MKQSVTICNVILPTLAKSGVVCEKDFLELEQRKLMGLKSSMQSHPVDHLLKHYLEVQRKEILAANDEMFKRFSSVYLSDEPRRPPPARSSFLLTLF